MQVKQDLNLEKHQTDLKEIDSEMEVCEKAVEKFTAVEGTKDDLKKEMAETYLIMNQNMREKIGGIVTNVEFIVNRSRHMEKSKPIASFMTNNLSINTDGGSAEE